MTYKESIQTVAAAALPWEKLDGCNILITGATGLIGACLVEVLMNRPNRNYRVYASGRDETRARNRFKAFVNDDGFRFFCYDVTQPLQGNTPFHYIVHAAGDAVPQAFATRPVEVIKANIYGLVHLMEYGLQNGLCRLLYVSSGEVYGEGDGRVFTEDYSGYVDSMSPRACYPSAKRAAETLCVSYGVEYGIETVVARPCHVYGPYFTSNDNRVYAQFLRNVLRGEDIVMKSSGTALRSWCYVVDCVSALLHILLKGAPGEAYNIADASSEITIRDLACMLADAAGQQVRIELPAGAEKAVFNTVTKSLFSTAKLESLGWKVLPGSMRQKLAETLCELR